jgi:hypothetical protein
MGDVEAAITDARAWWEKYHQYGEDDGAKVVRFHELKEALLKATGDWHDINTRVLLFAAYNGDPIADELLRKAVYWFGVRGPVPAPLMYYVCFGESKKGKRRSAEKIQYRGFLLAAIVHRIVERGFKPTRRRLKKKEGHSACSIAAEATKHSETVVEKAWQKFGKLPEIAGGSLSEELSRE